MSRHRAAGGGGGGGSGTGFLVPNKSKTAFTQLHLRAERALAQARKSDRSLLKIKHNSGQTTFAAFMHMGVLFATKSVGAALGAIGVLLMVNPGLAYTDKDRDVAAKNNTKLPKYQSMTQELIRNKSLRLLACKLAGQSARLKGSLLSLDLFNVALVNLELVLF